MKQDAGIEGHSQQEGMAVLRGEERLEWLVGAGPALRASGHAGRRRYKIGLWQSYLAQGGLEGR